MAIAFVAAGTPVGVDTSSAGQPVLVPIPAGLAANQLLVMSIACDDQTGPISVPAGWHKLTGGGPGTPTTAPYFAPPRAHVYWKIATGSEGSTVSVGFLMTPWPSGRPFVSAAIVSYSGTDLASPIETWGTAQTLSTAAALAHPALTTTVTGDWLLTLRYSSAHIQPAPSTVVTGGTNSERIDSGDGQTELFQAIYDSNGALASGLQTQRTTTSSVTPDFGSIGLSIAIRPPNSAIATASAGEADGIGTAYGATAVTADGPWQLCDSMPVYSFAVDWNGDGSLATPGANLSMNPYFLSGTTNWAGSAAGIQAIPAPQNSTGITSLLVTPDGVTASGGVNQAPRTPVGSVTAGNTYVTDAWVYSPGGWSDLRSAVDWYDASNAFLSSSLGSGTVVAAGVWTHLVQTFTAPALASRASVRVRHGGTPPATAVYYVYGLLLVDPAAAGTFSAPSPGEDVTPGVLDGGVSVSYGRDQSRQLTPAKTGTASFALNNTERLYSPENTAGPLFGDLDPARNMRADVAFNGASYPLGRMRVDDYDVHADLADRSASFSFLDGMKDLDGIKLRTGVLRSQRTGDLVNFILDRAGWTGPRAVDPGATIVAWWWLDGVPALQAVQDLVKSEGPPSIAYVALDGTFVFRDRHHRILSPRSLTPQAYYTQGQLGECASPAATGLSFTGPFEYAHGWRDIVNSVSFSSDVRTLSADLTAVWSNGTAFTLANGQAVTITASSSDPFMNAVVPVAGTDYTTSGPGTISVSLSRTDGASVDLTVLAVGGSVTVSGLQLRAQAITISNTVVTTRKDTGSISSHGEQTYPDTAPWAGPQDAYAVAGLILLHYSQRRPVVQLRITASDPRHLFEILFRAISDRIHITYGEMGLDDDFFIETITHTVSRMNTLNRPPVHAVVLGCEKQTEVIANPFRFDVRGSGFDQGVFDPLASDDPSQVFVWDDPRGSFDFGLFGT